MASRKSVYAFCVGKAKLSQEIHIVNICRSFYRDKEYFKQMYKEEVGVFLNKKGKIKMIYLQKE